MSATTAWFLASVVLLLGAMAPALLLSSRRGPTDRLVGVFLGGSVAVLVALLLSQADGESPYLIVPLALAVLALTGCSSIPACSDLGEEMQTVARVLLFARSSGFSVVVASGWSLSAGPVLLIVLLLCASGPAMTIALARVIA